MDCWVHSETLDELQSIVSLDRLMTAKSIGQKPLGSPALTTSRNNRRKSRWGVRTVQLLDGDGEGFVVADAAILSNEGSVPRGRPWMKDGQSDMWSSLPVRLNKQFKTLALGDGEVNGLATRSKLR